MPQRRIDQRVRLGHVVVEVALGLPDRFADFYIAGKVDHGLRPVAREHLVEPRLVADVALLERRPLHGPLVAFLERVVTDGFVASLGQRLADVAADIAGAAGNRDCDRHVARNPPRRQAALLRQGGGSPSWGRTVCEAPARSRMVPVRDLNPDLRFTKPLHYRCANPALRALSGFSGDLAKTAFGCRARNLGRPNALFTFVGPHRWRTTA